MEQFKESTKATLAALKAHALLSKALSNDPKPTPGYLFPEISRLTQVPASCATVLSQLIKAISPGSSSFIPSSAAAAAATSNTTSSSSAVGGSINASQYSSVFVLIKALKLLRQLAQSGSIEFRTGLNRQGKSFLADLAGYRGPRDEIHGDQYNQDVRTAAETLIDYLHDNPVPIQEPVVAAESSILSAKERAVLENSTQGLSGFGYSERNENSDSAGENDTESEEDQVYNEARQSRPSRQQRESDPAKQHRKQRRYLNRNQQEKDTSVFDPPPLPGFGNPEFEDPFQSGVNGGNSWMARMVDRLQDLAAPPPPTALMAAQRQEEHRRHQLFVGDYKIRPSDGQEGQDSVTASIANLGQNPFPRTRRIPGQAAKGWADAPIAGQSLHNSAKELSHVSRVVREWALSVSLGSIRTHHSSKQDSSLMPSAALLGGEGSSQAPETVWGSAKDICIAIVAAASLSPSTPSTSNPGILASSLQSLEPKMMDLMSLHEPSPEVPEVNTSSSTPIPISPTMAGLVHDLMNWINHESWMNRLRYLFVIDILVAYPETRQALLEADACRPQRVLLKNTLSGPRCLGATQESVSTFSRHLLAQFP